MNLKIEKEYRKQFGEIYYGVMPKVFEFAREMFLAEHPDWITVRDNVK